MPKTKLEIIKDTIRKIFDLLEVEGQIEVIEKEGVFNVNLKTQSPGILIGYHGRTLSSLQTILGMIIYRKLGEWFKIVVDINDYRERRREILEKMALSAAQRVKFSKEPYALPPMNSAERRIIHLTLSGDPEIKTESEGEGEKRQVVVKPRND